MTDRIVARIIILLLVLIVQAVFDALPPEPKPEKDWCRNEWGHTRPMEFCQ